jgi:hypothetical protein
MTEQLAFEYRPPAPPSRCDQFDEEAHQLLVAHPDVWRLFCRYAFELIAAGRDHGGAKAIVERIRWEHATSAHRRHDPDEPYLNNNHTASYARIFADTYPERAEFFRMRGRPAATRRARAA